MSIEVDITGVLFINRKEVDMPDHYVRLKAEMETQHIKAFTLAKRAGINSPDLYSALKGEKPIYPNWKKRIAAALNTSEEELFEKEEVAVPKDLDRLKVEMEAQHIKAFTLAKRAGIDPPALYCALNGSRVMYPGWKKRIAKTLNVSEEELFNKGGE